MSSIVVAGDTSGSVTLSVTGQTLTSPVIAGTLDRVRITTISGVATFSAGSINIMYE